MRHVIYTVMSVFCIISLYGAADNPEMHPTLYQVLLPHLVNPKVNIQGFHPKIQEDIQERRVQRYHELRQDVLRPFRSIEVNLDDFDASATILDQQTREAVALGMVKIPQETTSCRDKYLRMLAVLNITPSNTQLACAGLALCSMVGSFVLAVEFEQYGASWILAFPLCIGSIACLINTAVAKHLFKNSLFCNSRRYMETLLPEYAPHDQHSLSVQSTQPIQELDAVLPAVEQINQMPVIIDNVLLDQVNDDAEDSHDEAELLP